MHAVPPYPPPFPYTTLFRSRAVLVLDGATTDVEEASGGRFGPDPMHVYDNWPAFAEFATGITSGTAALVEAERSEEHTSELQSLRHLVCRLLLEKKKT